MPRPDQDESPWLRTEWIVSSGLAVALAAGLIWVGTIDERVAGLKDAIGGLDNVTLGNRITALEVALRHADIQQDRVERKIDRLLDRRYGGGSGPSPSGGNQE